MRNYILAILLLLFCLHTAAKNRVYDMSRFGILPDNGINDRRKNGKFQSVSFFIVSSAFS